MACCRSRRTHAPGFTLIELLVVIAIVAILAALLFPVMTHATMRARVARVHSDLRQISVAIAAYKDDCGGLPPVRSCCSGSTRFDYNEIPTELTKMHYLATARMYDPFNRTIGEDNQLGRTYKYAAVNWGYTNGNKGSFSMWIPRDYPICKEECVLYYQYAKQVYVYDGGKTYPKAPPVTWVLWSVGPAGDPGLEGSGVRMLPTPRGEWYPTNEKGVIVRFGDGRKSP